MDTEVLIIGAGPTGLMLANQLGRRGIPTLIIDRHSGPAQQTRAMAVQARTLEIYAKLGIVPRALALGRRANGANMWAQGRPMARIPLGDIGQHVSPFPFVLLLGQDDNERILGEHLRHWHMAVQWHTELLALDQSADYVTAKLKQADGTTREITAAYVAGCDGGHSAVRELSHIDFPGAPYEQVFFVADTEASGAMVPDELNVYLWRDGFHLFFPIHGQDRWRVIGVLPKQFREREDLRFEDLSADISREVGGNLTFKQCPWFSTYCIHHRVAEKFRERRCFLLGDAAHVHSPMGGQGMNTGLQDAYNLAWKLALVINGQADPQLLDTYAAERLPVARRLLSSTDRAFTLLVAETWLASLFRTRILARIAAFAMRFAHSRQIAFRALSQTGIAYRHSPLSKTGPGLPAAAPRAGDRFPWLRLKLRQDGPVQDLYASLDDTCFNLLVLGQPQVTVAPLAWGPWLRTYVIPREPVNDHALARAQLTGPLFYLLRPDGHVGLAGTHFDASAVSRYLDECRIRRGAQHAGRAGEATYGRGP